MVIVSPRRERVDGDDELLGAADRFAVDGDDDVLLADAGRVGGALPGSTLSTRAPSRVPSVTDRALTPSEACTASPVEMSCSAMSRTVSIGIAKPEADRPPPFAEAMAVLMPMSAPVASTRAPPELPGLIGASVCTALMTALVSLPSPARPHRPVQRADDAAGDRAGQAERGADGHHRVADDDVVGVAQRAR